MFDKERLDPDEKGVYQMDTPGGKQEMICINEFGLYNVLLRSDKPEAKPFRKWVTSEALPTIRKHGAYAATVTIDAIINQTRKEDAIWQKRLHTKSWTDTQSLVRKGTSRRRSARFVSEMGPQRLTFVVGDRQRTVRL